MSAVLDLRAAEREMLAAVGEAVLAGDDHERIVSCNAAAERLYGVSADAVVGQPLHDIVTPDLTDGEAEAIRAALAGGRSWSGTVTGRRPTGATFEHRLRLVPRHDEHGRVIGVISVGIEVVETVGAVDHRFRRVFDQSPVAMALVGLDATIQKANPALERLLGYTAAELEGLSLADISHPEDLEEDLDSVRRMIAGEIPSYQMQKRFLRRDGTEVIGRLTAHTVHDEDGVLTHAIGAVEDLTATLGAFAALQEQKERLATTLVSAGIATWDLDFTTMRQTVSDNYADLLGIPFDEVPETFDEVLAMVHPDDQHLFLDPTPDPDAAGDRFDVEFRMVRPRGGTVWVGCKGSFLRDAEGEPSGIHGTLVNLTDQRTVEIRRVEAEERYRQTIEAANDAFVGVDGDGRIQEWNAAAERMFGWGLDEVVGRRLLTTVVPPDRRQRYAEGMAQWSMALQAGGDVPERWEMTAMHRDGHTLEVEMSVVPAVDEQGNHIRAFVRDISARRAYERRLVEQAVTDALTGLPDRTVLTSRIAEATGRLVAGGGSVGVLFIDLDRFKAVNDERGHEAGDQILVEVARRLRGAVRPGDTVARLGGDEFAVACEDLAGAEGARQVAERILAALEPPFLLDGEHHPLAVSIGIALASDAGGDGDGLVSPEALLRDADRAMYSAKAAGGARYAAYGG